ncbi:MAG: peptide deformylase [Planctomycetota bacterium]
MIPDLATLSIVHYPDPVLTRRAKDIEEVDGQVLALAERMVELMHEAPGIGLAAPQVGLGLRMFVLHVPASDDPTDELSVDTDPPTASGIPMAFINPEITERSKDLVAYSEGCLSLPNITGDVRRPSSVTVEATGFDGKRFRVHAGGLLARCIQHEYDHLDGILILSKFGRMDRMRNRHSIAALEESGV